MSRMSSCNRYLTAISFLIFAMNRGIEESRNRSAKNIVDYSTDITITRKRKAFLELVKSCIKMKHSHASCCYIYPRYIRSLCN